MTALRQLSVVYVAAAGAYAVAMAISAHPHAVREAEATARFVTTHAIASAEAFDQHVLRPDFKLAEGAGRALGHRIAVAFSAPPTRATVPSRLAQTAPAKPVSAKHPMAVAQIETGAPTAPPATAPAAPNAAPDFSQPAPAPQSAERDKASAQAGAAPQPPALRLAPQAPSPPASSVASLPPQGPPDAGEIMRVQDRLKNSLTQEMFENFALFLYVSKADAGPWAQRMYVFKKESGGDLDLLYNWPVSTGREQIELNSAGKKLKTETPPGYYELDPNRSYEHYRSAQWGQLMPYAMFFNWVRNGDETGLAIHAASGDDVNRLGQRASAGCIHLSEDNARTLFTMIREQYKGLAPRFAIDRRTGTMSNEGILLHDANGKIKFAEGYKVLVFIEDYGGENVVAALY